MNAIGINSSQFYSPLLTRECMARLTTDELPLTFLYFPKIIKLVTVLQWQWETACSLASYAPSGAVIMNKSFRLEASSSEYINTDST